MADWKVCPTFRPSIFRVAPALPVSLPAIKEGRRVIFIDGFGLHRGELLIVTPVSSGRIQGELGGAGSASVFPGGTGSASVSSACGATAHVYY